MMKQNFSNKNFTLFVLIIFLHISIFFLSFSIKNNVVYENKDFNWKNVYQIIGVSKFLFKNNIAYALKENEYSYNSSSDLILHFDSKYKEDLYISGNYKKVYVSYIPDTNNKILGSVVVLRDITKEVENERLKDEFIGNISHELRTPIIVIKGYIQILQMFSMGQWPENQVDLLQKIAMSTDDLHN